MTTQVQAVGAATAAATPASITANYAATTAGNFLLCIIAAIGNGTQPTIASPGGAWVNVFNNAGTQIRIAVYIQQQNAGGITAVTAALTNTTGACMIIAEYSGVPAVQLQHINTNGAAGVGTTFNTVQALQQLQFYLERWFVAFAHNTAQAQSTTPGNAYVQVGTTQVSTVGALNIELRVYMADISSNTWSSPAAVLAGATDNASSLTRITTEQSRTGVVVGPAGSQSPGGYSGAGGGGPG